MYLIIKFMLQNDSYATGIKQEKNVFSKSTLTEPKFTLISVRIPQLFYNFIMNAINIKKLVTNEDAGKIHVSNFRTNCVAFLKKRLLLSTLRYKVDTARINRHSHRDFPYKYRLSHSTTL